VLEKIILNGDGNQKEVASDHSCIFHASLLLAKELQPQTGLLGRALNGDYIARQSLQSYSDADSITKNTTETLESDEPSRKRKRGGSMQGQTHTQEDTSNSLPSDDILRATIDAFFSSTHHWVPFLHPFRFRRDIEDPHRRPKLEIILHAIAYASMHRLDLESLNIQQSEMERQVELSRSTVILNALDSLTIENVQALIIVAFTAVSLLRLWSIMLTQIFRLPMDKFARRGLSLAH
jgi:hypothetical protein